MYNMVPYSSYEVSRTNRSTTDRAPTEQYEKAPLVLYTEFSGVLQLDALTRVPVYDVPTGRRRVKTSITYVHKNAGNSEIGAICAKRCMHFPLRHRTLKS